MKAANTSNFSVICGGSDTLTNTHTNIWSRFRDKLSLLRSWKLIMKAGIITSPLHKTNHNKHQYTDPLIFLHLQCFSVLHQLCWHTVVPYAKNADMKIENILPFAFPFGIGGLHTIRTVSGKTNRHGQVIPTRQHAKPWGHTQAAKHARRRYFAMLDFFGHNSLFMS